MLGRREAVACGCGFLTFLSARLANAQPVLGPFSIPELEQARVSYGPGVRAMFYNDLINRLPPTKRSLLANIRLEMPVSEDPSFPLAARSRSDYGVVELPVRTILFIQQYAALLAYYTRNGCPAIQPFVYARMLVSDKAVGTRPPGPLKAFGLSRAIYQDEFVRDVARKTAATTLFFILAHELGHLFHNHVPGLQGPASIAQEKQADAFALDAASDVGVFPMGMAMYFQVMAVSEGPQNTHPLSSDRMEAIARRVASNPAAFMDPHEDPARFIPRVLEVAETLRRIARKIDHTEVRTNFDELAV